MRILFSNLCILDFRVHLAKFILIVNTLQIVYVLLLEIIKKLRTRLERFQTRVKHPVLQRIRTYILS